MTVNNVQPAVVQAEPPPGEGPTFEAMRRFTSVGRAVAFLASPEAGFINGASLNVDSGWGA